MTPEQLTQLIMNYVDEAIANKVSENRFKLDRLSSSFSEWENTYMGKYDGNETVTHSTLRQLMYQLDAVYDYNLVQSSNDALDRVLWVNPNLNSEDNPTSGDRGIISALTNVVLTGKGVRPSLHADPLNPIFNLKNNITLGGIAYNLTDDKWYYSKADGTIVDFKTGVIGMDEVNGLTQLLQDLTSLPQAYSTHISDSNIHAEPDGTTIKIVNSKLEAQLYTFSNPLSLDTNRNITLKYNTDDFGVDVGGNIYFKRSIPDITLLISTVNSHTTSIRDINTSIDSLDLRVDALEERSPGTGSSTGEVLTITNNLGTAVWYLKAVGTSLGFYNASNVLVATLSNTGIFSAKDEVSAFSTL